MLDSIVVWGFWIIVAIAIAKSVSGGSAGEENDRGAGTIDAGNLDR